ncbi:FecR family protein [Xylophilus sp.]|uniref:FecR family protein n=1 Tax=Xylophilus sp. TaxID=2653893 RepID=UPI0013BC8527|nr:FecR domain-containing protein [Xylophilus sp.]KAF1049286.1 MAG: Protein FecR [Xylophilus sp.]
MAAEPRAAAPRPPAQPDAAQAALDRHRQALRERFALPPEALGPLPPAPRRRARAAAGVAAAVAIAGVLWADPAWRTERIATATAAAGRRQVQLADGSEVTLDTATEIAVSRHLRSRRVALLRGQALFDVAHSRWRPFTVDAGAARVRVLGTAFSVGRQDGGRVAVTVLRGRVAVEDAAGALVAQLTPGWQARLEAGRWQAPARVDAQAATAWREGRLVFSHTPLPQVLAEIERYGGLGVRPADDPALAGLRLSGVYRTDNARALLDLLPHVLPVRVDRAADGSATVALRP